MNFVKFESRLNNLDVRVNPDGVLFIAKMEDHIECTRIIFPSNRELEVLGTLNEVENMLNSVE